MAAYDKEGGVLPAGEDRDPFSTSIMCELNASSMFLLFAQNTSMALVQSAGARFSSSLTLFRATGVFWGLLRVLSAECLWVAKVEFE